MSGDRGAADSRLLLWSADRVYDPGTERLNRRGEKRIKNKSLSQSRRDQAHALSHLLARQMAIFCRAFVATAHDIETFVEDSCFV